MVEHSDAMAQAIASADKTVRSFERQLRFDFKLRFWLAVLSYRAWSNRVRGGRSSSGMRFLPPSSVRVGQHYHNIPSDPDCQRILRNHIMSLLPSRSVKAIVEFKTNEAYSKGGEKVVEASMNVTVYLGRRPD